MSKRNFILLVIVLVISLGLIFMFLFTQPNTGTPQTGNTGTNFISNFNPFGNNKPPATTTPPANISGSETTTATPVTTAKLLEVSSMPIAGFTVYSKERLKDPLTSKVTEFVPALRYVARETGNIYETFADKIAEQKFSATIIPKIYEAFFGNKGQAVVMRYLNTDGQTIETFVGNLPKEFLGTDIAGNAEVKGSFLPENIKDTSVSGDTSSMFYLFNSADNVTGTTLNFTTNKKTQIFTSPFTEWASFWPKSSVITLTTRPAAGVLGYMYSLDTGTKNLSNALGGVDGLTTETSPNGKLVLYGDSGLTLNVYHTDTKTSTLLGVKTLPEKCVWGGASDVVYCAVPKVLLPGPYPDAWYQGTVSFSDQIWKINVGSGNATIIADPLSVSGGEDIDGIKLALDSGENYLFFVNKKDSFLWELQLK